MLEAFRLTRPEVAAREEALRVTVRALSDPERHAYHRIYADRVKDPDTYAVLNWLCVAGLHHFYLGKLARGAANLLVMLIGIAIFIPAPLLGAAMVGAIVLIELPALMRSEIIVADHNVELGLRTLKELNFA